MELMGLADFQSVFIGIETPNEDSLKETKKLQNVRPNAGTLLERIHRVQEHGLDVWCGMIVGFDHDDPSIFDVMPKFLAESRISAALIGLLHAIPTTPLYDRLKQAGRLNDRRCERSLRHQCRAARHVTRELRDGFIASDAGMLCAGCVFRPARRPIFDEDFKFAMHELPYWTSHRVAWAKRCFFNYVKFGAVASTAVVGV